ncbi:MAG: hypothetical protein GOVbin1709_86 [Prokaryotic dsDNA virus sp.]|nr:MAG: hypothetical protein GOVbin1709_86 [Prokaryotic dsDNA virus sp.]|tara:strand:+ start:4569 stop:4820 length:252 start_codon:yes stop_codon:yes gene_type:complete
MAKCIHGNVIDQCGFCRKESMHKIVEGTMSTTERPKGVSRPDLKEILQDVDHQAEQEKRDEIMKEYILNSFTTKLEDKEDQGE